MKYIYVLVISVCFSTQTYSQNYDSLIKPSKRWEHYCRHSSEPSYFRHSCQITNFSKILFGKKYFYVIRNSSGSDSLWVSEENKKVWFLHYGSKVKKPKELLLYDFNLEIGDTFTFYLMFEPNLDSFSQYKKIVNKIDTINGRKVINFYNFLHPFVEGIGFEYYIYFDYAFFRSFISEYACNTCVHDKRYIIYPYNGACDSTTFDIKQLNVEKLNIFPNPFNSELTFEVGDYEKYNIQIFDIKGNELDRFEIIGEMKFLNTLNYTSGIYYLKLSNNNNVLYYKVIKL